MTFYLVFLPRLNLMYFSYLKALKVNKCVRKTLFGVFICFLGMGVRSQLFGQNSLKGKLIDSLENHSLYRAVVALSSKQDSVLRYFTWSKTDGSFEIQKILPGKYVIQISYTSYADYWDTIDVSSSVDMGNVNMLKLATVMTNVFIQSYKGAIRIKGDTTEFVADSFKTRDGAVIEDLLRKLPGVQVNKNGEIVAQGKKVERFLVDGEEFFGNDPTLATKNLDAKVVDKVQVYDAKSENATTTGTDETTVRVMDIKLKDEAKKGYFGKLMAGSSLNNIYEGRAMINAFKKSRKINAYSTFGNSPNVGLDWSERDEFGSGNSREFSEEEGYYYTYYNGDNDFDYYLNYTQGLPRFLNGGANYFNKFNNDKLTFSAGVQGRYLNLNAMNETNSTTILSERSIQQYNTENVNNDKTGYSAYVKAEIKLDSLTTLNLKINAQRTEIDAITSNTSGNRQGSGQFLNAQRKTNTLNGLKEDLNFTATLNKKFSKKDRKLYSQFKYSNENSNNFNRLNATNEIYDFAVADTQTLIFDQGKKNNSAENRLNYTVRFIEPINKKWKWVTAINQSLLFANSDRITQNYTGSILNENRVDSLSSIAKFYQNLTTASSNISYRVKKFTMGLGVRVNYLYQHQKEEIRNYDYETARRVNVLPELNLLHEYAKQSRWSMRYNIGITMPDIQKLQPIVDNSNPLYLQVGNPQLKPEINHTLSLNWSDNKILKKRWFWSYLNFSARQSGMVNSTFIDTSGRTVSRFINMNGNYNLNGNMSIYKTFEFKSVSLSVEGGLNPNFRISQNEVNFKSNKTISATPSGTFGLNIEILEALNIGSKINHIQNYSQSTLQESQVNQNWIQTLESSISCSLPKDFYIETTMEINLRQKNEFYSNNSNNILWNASITKQWLKSKKLETTIGAYDLLKQNFGYNRNVWNNTVSENRFNTFTQFFYGRITWRFNNKTKAMQEDKK